jgi:hypothetical protein
MTDHDDFERRLGEAMRAYADEAPTGVEALALARVIAGTYPRAAWRRLGLEALRPRRLLSGLAMAALLALLALALVVIASRRPTLPEGRLSFGIDGWASLVASGDGTIWGSGSSGISRFDPAHSSVRVFGMYDDPRFAPDAMLGPAVQGGVWLSDPGGGAIRFDGQAFREVLSLPDTPETLSDPRWTACQLVDGRSPIATCAGVVWRLDGGDWHPITPALPAGQSDVRVVADGAAIWATASDGDSNTLWEYRASGWVRHDEHPALDFEIYDIAVAPDGTAWAGGELNVLARYDGEAWHRRLLPTVLGDPHSYYVYSLAIDDDGTLWGVGEWSGVHMAFRYDDTGITTFGLAGLAGQDENVGWSPSIIAGKSGVFATAPSGLARLEGDRFVRVAKGREPRLAALQSIAVDGVGQAFLLGAGDGSPYATGLGRITDGRYEHLKTQTIGGPLKAGGDGTIWAQTPSGPARWTGTAFEGAGPELDIGAAQDQGFADDWPPFAIGPDEAVYTLVGSCLRQASTCADDERIVRLAGDRWEPLPEHPAAASGVTDLTVTSDGAVWVITGRISGRTGIARHAGDEWESLPLPAADQGSMFVPPGKPVPGDEERWAPVPLSAVPVSWVGAIAVGTDGAIWVSLLRDLGDQPWCRPGGVCDVLSVARLDRGVWTVFTDVEETSFGLAGLHAFGDLVVARDGSVWVNSAYGVARFDGQHWKWEIAPYYGYGLRHMTLGADGSIWAAGDGVVRLAKAP